jgi:hypothetical protein
MAGLSDLPPEIMMLIFQSLPYTASTSTCLASKQLYAASLPFLYASFTWNCNPQQTLSRFRSFVSTIGRDRTLGGHVKSVLIDEFEKDDDIAALWSLLLPLLFHTPNIQQLAIPGHSNLLPWLRNRFSSGGLSLQYLQDFRCVHCGPEVWEVVHRFPRFSRLSLANHYCGPSTLQLPASSFPIEHIRLERCNLGYKAVCAVVRSCERLLSFRYLRPCSRQDIFVPPRMTVNAREIYEALLPHKAHLKEPHVEHNNGAPYHEAPKFGSFRDFSALRRLSVECNALSVQASLPPSECKPWIY